MLQLLYEKKNELLRKSNLSYADVLKLGEIYEAIDKERRIVLQRICGD